MIAAASRVTPKGFFWLAVGATGALGVGGLAVRAGIGSHPVAQAAKATPNTPGGNGGGNANGNGNGNTSQGKAFTMSGSATGLYPGADRPLVLTVDNPNEQAIRVETLTVRIGNATGQCPGSLLSVDSFAPFVVEGRGSGSTTLQIHLDPTTTNACRDKTWALTYTGTAVKA